MPAPGLGLPLIGLWPAALVLMQATLARSGGFDVTVGVVACHAIQLYLLALRGFRRPSRMQLVVVLVVLLQVLVLAPAAGNLDQFARSLAQLLNLILMILICANLAIGDWRCVRRSIAVFCLGGLIVAVLVGVQFVAFNVFEDGSYARLLGPWSPPLAPATGQFYMPRLEGSLGRPNGPFSEPSVAGWFLIFTAAVAISSRAVYPRLASLTVLASALGAALTLSLTGILGMASLLLAWLLLIRDRRRFKLLIVLVAGLGAALAMATTAGDALLGRADELERPGTSVYVRFVAPLAVVARSLVDAPLGLPIGQAPPGPEIVTWLDGVEANLDNMLFTIVLHFGLLGVVMNLAYVVELMRWLVVRRRTIGLILLAVLLMLTATGAGWAHQSVLLTGYAILVGRYLLARERQAQPKRRTPPPAATRPLPREPRPAGTPAAALPRVGWLRPGAPP